MNIKDFNKKYQKMYDGLQQFCKQYEEGMKKYNKNSKGFRENELGYSRTSQSMALLQVVLEDFNSINKNDS